MRFIIFIVNSMRFSYIKKVQGKGKGHPRTGTEALYRLYGPQGE